MTWTRVGLAVLTCALPGVAEAYIDPGTGSILVQGLIAALAMVAVFFGRIRSAIGRLLKRKEHQDDAPRDKDSSC